MAANTETLLTPAAALRAVYRHREKAVAFFILTILLTGVAWIVWPRSYMSESKIFVKHGRKLTLDPTVTTGETVSVHETRDLEINSILEMISSRVVFEKTVQRLGPDVVLGLSEELPATPPADADADRVKYEKAVKLLQDETKIFTPKKTTMIVVQFKAGSPVLARAIVAEIVEVYLEIHAEANRMQGSYPFFVAQEKKAQEKLRKLNAEMKLAKNETGVASLDEKRRLIQSRVSEIEQLAVKNHSDLAAASAEVSALEDAIATLPEKITKEETVGFPNVAADSAYEQFYALEVQLGDLLAKYRDDHPQVVALKEQIEESRKVLNLQPAKRTQTTTAKHPARQELETALLKNRALVSSFEARDKSLVSRQRLAMDELRKLNTQEVQLVDLQRQVDLAEANFREYSRKLEQARIDEEIQQERISNISVMQPATFVAKAHSPRGTYVLLGGCVLGMFGAFAVALLAEQMTPAINSELDVEQSLELPVFVTLPQVSRRNVLLN